MRSLLPLGLGLVLQAVPLAASAPPPEPIAVVFRFDDFSARSNTEIELRILAAFRAIDRPISMGMIPFACERIRDPLPQPLAALGHEKTDLFMPFVESGHLEPFLHGYTHSTRKGDRFSEFTGMPEEEQFRLLSAGKAYLEALFGRRMDIVSPPWNNYDAATLRAAERAGFRLFSGRVTQTPASGETSLRFAPSTSGLHDLREAIATARSQSIPGALLVPTFHEYDFKEMDAERGRFTFAEFEEILRWVASQPDLRIVSFGELLDEGMDLGVDRFSRYAGYFRSKAFFLAPSPFRNRDFPGVYLSESAMRSLVWRGRFLIAITLIPILLAAVWIGRRLFLRLRPGWAAPMILLVLGGLVLGWQLEIDKALYLKKTMLVFVLAGLACGAALARRGLPGRTPPESDRRTPSPAVARN